MLTVDALDHLVLNVRDIEASAAWYQRVLGMRRVDAKAADGNTRTSMMFGRNKINLRPIATSQELWFTGLEPCAGSDDLCFLTQLRPDDVASHFRDCGVEIIVGPTTRSGALGEIRSVYVRDPDGNLIEVSSYSSEPSA